MPHWPEQLKQEKVFAAAANLGKHIFITINIPISTTQIMLNLYKC